jgi:hypothetical protein
MEKLLVAADLMRTAITVEEVPEPEVPVPEAVVEEPPPQPVAGAVVDVPDDMVILG